MQRAYDMTKRAAAVEGTRRRIAEAALELFKARDYDAVSLNEIARAAGVSHQTVLNHCESKAGVAVAVAAVYGEQVQDLMTDAVPGDVGSIVSTTCARYEVLGDANVHWEAMSSRAPEVADGVAQGRATFQAWLREMFGAPAEQQRVLFGLYAALDVHTWKLLRRDLGLSREQTEQQMTDLVLGVLAQHRS